MTHYLSSLSPFNRTPHKGDNARPNVVINTTLCIVDYYRLLSAETCTDNVKLYAKCKLAELTNAKDELIGLFTKASIDFSSVKDHAKKYNSRSSVVSVIVRLLNLTKVDSAPTFHFYPEYSEMNVIMDQSASALKLNKVGEQADKLQTQFEAFSQSVNRISEGMNQVSEKAIDATTMAEIVERVTKKVCAQYSPMKKSVTESNLSNSVTNTTDASSSGVEPSSGEDVSDPSSLPSLKDSVDFNNLTKRQKIERRGAFNSGKPRIQPKPQNSFATALARKPMPFGTGDTGGTRWGVKVKRAIKVNFSSERTIEDIREWCKKSAKLKDHELICTETGCDSNGRRVQIICNDWPLANEPFSSLSLWPANCRIRAYDDAKPIRQHRKRPFLPLFIGNCSLSSTKEGVKKVVDKCYENEEVKPHVMVEEFEKSDSTRKAFVVRVGAPSGTSKCPKDLVTPHFLQLRTDSGKPRRVLAYCRDFGGTLPESLRNHGLTSGRDKNEELVSSFV